VLEEGVEEAQLSHVVDEEGQVVVGEVQRAQCEPALHIQVVVAYQVGLRVVYLAVEQRKGR